MKASEIRELNDADLATRIAELERERFNLRFQGATTQLEDPLRQRHVRRDIARLKTVQRERAADGAKGAKGAKDAKGKGGAGTGATAAKKSARGKRAQAKATGGTTTKATAARKAPAKKKAATGAGR